MTNEEYLAERERERERERDRDRDRDRDREREREREMHPRISLEQFVYMTMETHYNNHVLQH